MIAPKLQCGWISERDISGSTYSDTGIVKVLFGLLSTTFLAFHYL